MTVILHTDITYSYVVNVIVMRQNLVLFHGIVYIRANMQAIEWAVLPMTVEL